ncbi:MAG: Electron transport complex protein RnfD [bacterium ADurb.Bin243]|nr:MAG: Electron transport complex protein RnfD [bacterium ADurb.Bin243]HOD39057.1 RnfABCDGE type electron transport complex subunit D [Candidatus Wallbacteria bacterium]
METKDKKWIVGQGSHIYFPQDTSKIMFQVILALLPASAMAVYVFGFDALKVLLIGVISAVAVEALIQKYLMKTPVTIGDYSAALTGLLLALNLPASSPWWMVCIGSLISIGIGKLAYGGLGQNPFNPALVGRVALLIGFPALMTDWSVTGGYLSELYRKIPAEALTTATPLGFIKAYSGSNFTADLVAYFNSYSINLKTLFIGATSGSIGEVSELALLLGALYLIYKKVLNWEIPAAFIGTVGIIAMAAYYVKPQAMLLPHYHLFSGGLFLGALFMATDMVTSPFTFRGRIVFGIGCGVLTMLIRLYGGYPEGVSFAILLMNIFVPIIDIYIKPKRFGV